MTTIKQATKRYEAWLAEHTTIVEADLKEKHLLMARDAFSFFRGTYYRWAQVWPGLCPGLAKAPQALAVGDLHVENFGTWRDREGRLIWGVNDFDEAAAMPYTNDLVRLATSACLAIQANHLAMDVPNACAALLGGYTDSLAAGGAPYVLAEKHPWLRQTALAALRPPEEFWQKMDSLPEAEEDVPPSALEGLKSLLPGQEIIYRLVRRRAGVGSLGHQRFVVIADWAGGQVAREAKALVPSAYLWATESQDPLEILYQAILSQSVRCRDPFVELRGQWIVRRLAPDCTRIELAALPKTSDETHLLRAMGWETANIHLGSLDAIPAITTDLADRKAGWLHIAAEKMAAATISDWQDWK